MFSGYSVRPCQKDLASQPVLGLLCLKNMQVLRLHFFQYLMHQTGIKARIQEPLPQFSVGHTEIFVLRQLNTYFFTECQAIPFEHALYSAQSVLQRVYICALSLQKFFWTNLLLCSSQVKQKKSVFFSCDKFNYGWRRVDPRIHYNQTGLLLLAHMPGGQTHKIFTVLTFYPSSSKSTKNWQHPQHVTDI